MLLHIVLQLLYISEQRLISCRDHVFDTDEKKQLQGNKKEEIVPLGRNDISTEMWQRYYHLKKGN